MIIIADTFGNNLKPGGGSEGFRSTKDERASADNFVRGFSSFLINKLIPRGATVGPKVPLSEKVLRSLCFITRTLDQVAKECTFEGLYSFG